MTRAYRIPSEALDDLEAAVAKLNKAARKLGCDELSIETLAEVSYPVFKQDTSTRDWYQVGIALDYVVTVVGEAPRIPGWEFIATIQHEEAGNILRWSDVGQALEPAERTTIVADYGHGAPYCDHCQTSRRRVDTYIVRERETNRLYSVGSNCVRDFLGHTDPKRILQLLEAFGALLGRLSRGSDEEGGFGYGRDRSYQTLTDEFLLHVAAVIREDGFVSRQRAQDTGAVATSHVALINLENCQKNKKNYRGEPAWTEPTEADQRVAEQTIAWVDQLEPNGNDFLHNLKVALSGETLNPRSYGIAAAGVASYQRAQAEALAKEVTKSHNSEYQGVIGKRMEVDVVCTRAYDYPGLYGNTRFHTLEDDQGNIYCWPSSGEAALGIGERAHIRGTVKKHSEYRGEKQTTLSRCILTDVAVPV